MPENLIGQVLFDQFRVDEFIASDGMGAVYRVWDLKRNVYLAMKMLHAEFVEEESVLRRFQREARALKKLTHPNIVPFYGYFQEGDLLIILESYINGNTLKEVLKQSEGHSLPIREALIFLKAVSAALGFAHANDVVHCDIKPGNIMLDQTGAIFLIDFGIARHAASTTTTVGVAGTHPYMAPEQIRGEALTSQTDIYALGVVLFELLTGCWPFLGNEIDAETAGATKGERIRYAHQFFPAPDPRSINPAIPVELSFVINRALEKAPEKRFVSAQEFFSACCAAAGYSAQSIPDRYPVNSLRPGVVSGPSTPIRDSPQPGTVSPVPAPQTRNRSWIAMIVGGLIVLSLLGVFFLPRLTSIFETGRASNPGEVAPQIDGTPGGKTISENSVMLTATADASLSAIPAERTPTRTPIPTNTPEPTATNTLISSLDGEPIGHIIFTCQVYKEETSNQVCVMNADGSGFRQLHSGFYGSVAPDGKSVIFVSKDAGDWDIYEMAIDGSWINQLTDGLGDFFAPEISPDGRLITAAHNANSRLGIWIMKRDGSNPHAIYISSQDSLDPTWSPDGSKILFASGVNENKQLYTMNPDGSNIQPINPNFQTRGRSDWSSNGNLIISYSGPSWSREIFIMNKDGSNLHQIGTEINSQGPGFSPDGQWITFTAYSALHYNDGCEIYIMKTDGSDSRRLTNNDYCDYQPRWGP
jgi:serine/threonine protein kinase